MIRYYANREGIRTIKWTDEPSSKLYGESNQVRKTKGELKLELNTDHIAVIKREYKKVRRYMKSSIYQVRMMDGTEKVVNELLDKYYKEEDARE